ncbi:MAG: hypothetical protein JNM17_20670 [Archangium sp.]|nr:hypothetical protein [Archangium sp.]
MRVVFDTILPLEPFFSFVREVRRVKAPTRVVLSTDSLGGVTARFEAEQAHVMVTILPVEATPSLEIRSLRRLKARLVAHRSHPLARASRLTQASLADHVLLTVRGSDPRLQLPTADLDRQSAVHLSDFHAKKDAIMAGLGFGWLPEWLIERELRTGALKALSIGSGAVHTFEPRAVVRAGSAGKATRLLLSALSE